jgi:hypothetical protein
MATQGNHGPMRPFRTDCQQCGDPDSGFDRYDHYNIYCGRYCDDCFSKKYRHDIGNPYHDYLEAGEHLEPEDY